MSFEKPIIIGISQATHKIFEIIKKLSNVDLNVLITGESGVGKELVARSLHYYSPKRNYPFVKVNCAALPPELLESELFGYEKGAFTGAERKKIGKFELAKHGSIFLDEIGELPLFMQAKLLQILQDKNYYRVGGDKEIEVNARVIAATNINMDYELSTGDFRYDLFYRLSTISIHIPPLRERKEDIQPLLEFLIKRHSLLYNLPPIEISSTLLDLFYQYHWPGNIRELENYLNRLIVLGNEKEIENEIRTNQNIKNRVNSSTSPDSDLLTNSDNEIKEIEEQIKNKTLPSLKEVRDQAIKHIEKIVIEKVLEETRWNRKEASKLLRISYRALLYKMKELEISPSKRHNSENHK